MDSPPSRVADPRDDRPAGLPSPVPIAVPTPHAPDPNPWLSALLAEPHAAYDPLGNPALFPVDAPADVRLARHLICAVLGAVAAVVLFAF